MNDTPSKRIEPISRTCAAAVVALLKAALVECRPADRALATFLRANHQLGSRDRRIISETLFSLLRWWGWLKHLTPELPPQQKLLPSEEGYPAVTPASPKEYERYFAALAACWLLDGRTELPPSVYWWLYKYGVQEDRLPKLPSDAPLHERRKLLRPFFGKDEQLPPMPLEDLLPAWAWNLTDLPCPNENALEWIQSRPPVWLRAQSKDMDRIIGELSAAEIRAVRSAHLPLAVRISSTGVNLRTLPAFQNGFLEVQDLASQCVGHICAPLEGESWWDCCAGAGGKTLHLAWLMKGKGTILATDKRVYKLDDLKKRLARTGRSNIRCKEWLGIDVQRYHNLFHGVLLDAPCSCSGTWRRNPDARWTTTPEDVEQLTQLQATLLQNASTAVAPGGRLVYATCSMFHCENQDIVNAFLKTNPEFELEPFTAPLTGEQTNGMLQIWPWHENCDAMFIARMKKKE